MKTADFDYHLPPELIAQEPLPERTASRMLVVDRKSRSFEHRHIGDLPDFLRADDVLVFNNTRVLPARVYGHWNDTGGQVELLLLEEKKPGLWEAMLRASRRERQGLQMSLAEGCLAGTVEDDAGSGRVLIRLNTERPLAQILDEHGVPPVPPYIKRSGRMSDRVELDRERYQTVYACEPGAVAAPTAGLHFSDDLLRQLQERGIAETFLTLHVGPGTFRPVKAENVEDHVMESERYFLDSNAADTINRARESGGRVAAVGSTSVRTLESVAAERGSITPCEGRTSLFIRPPYRFRAVDIMLTNFHLPRSTLLMMVCAFAGVHAGQGWRQGAELIMSAYRDAIQKRYRFYSYGDCMLIL